VRGDTYERLRTAANERGMTIAALVDALLSDVVRPDVPAPAPVIRRRAGSDDQSLTEP